MSSLGSASMIVAENTMELSKLEKSIVETVCYFDLQDYPLTAVEIWRWLYNPPLTDNRPPTLLEVDESLKKSQFLRELLDCFQGFYFLRGREQLVLQRKDRNLLADKKMKKAVKYVKLFRFFPTVRLIAVCSSLSAGNVKESSDIDMFIVAKNGTIWLTRFLLVTTLKILGQRPTLNQTKDKICLSYYVTVDSMDLEQSQAAQDDIVFTYYVDGFLPLYDPDGLYQQFYEINHWYRKRLPNSDWPNRTVLEIKNGRWSEFFQSVLEVVYWPLSNRLSRDWLCNLQLSIMPERLKSRANVDSNVIVTDRILKFHDKDNRVVMRQKWLNHVHQVAKQL